MAARFLYICTKTHKRYMWIGDTPMTRRNLLVRLLDDVSCCVAVHPLNSALLRVKSENASLGLYLIFVTTSQPTLILPTWVSQRA